MNSRQCMHVYIRYVNTIPYKVEFVLGGRNFSTNLPLGLGGENFTVEILRKLNLL